MKYTANCDCQDTNSNFYLKIMLQERKNQNVPPVIVFWTACKSKLINEPKGRLLPILKYILHLMLTIFQHEKENSIKIIGHAVNYSIQKNDSKKSVCGNKALS